MTDFPADLILGSWVVAYIRHVVNSAAAPYLKRRPKRTIPPSCGQRWVVPMPGEPPLPASPAPCPADFELGRGDRRRPPRPRQPAAAPNEKNAPVRGRFRSGWGGRSNYPCRRLPGALTHRDPWATTQIGLV